MPDSPWRVLHLSWKDKRMDFSVFVSRCPWHDLMVESGRERLSEKVCDLICRVENSVWAMEFSEAGCDEIKFEREDMICKGACRCVLWFGR